MVHDTYNPYTAVQRSPSQWFIFVPDAQPMNDTTMLTLSLDAVNLNTIPASESMSSLQSRYVVPEVIPFGSSSEVDTRSAGNPYSHHPNFTTPSQYFNHLGETSCEPQEEQENALTIMDIQQLKDPFQNYDMGAPTVKINPPNDVTINKNAFSSQSIADLKNIEDDFPIRESLHNQQVFSAVSPNETLNKKMLSPESIYELEQTDGNFEIKEVITNSFVFREFSPQSLADLREIRNFSDYTDFPGSSKDVATGIGISPSPYERFQFQWSENVAYGGI